MQAEENITETVKVADTAKEGAEEATTQDAQKAEQPNPEPSHDLAKDEPQAVTDMVVDGAVNAEAV